MGMDIQSLNSVDYSKKPFSSVDLVNRSDTQRELANTTPVELLSRTPKNIVTANAEIDAKKADKLLNSVNEKVKALQSFLKFEKDEDTEKMVFSIKNSETGEVIRQIPSKELLEVSKQISQYLERAQQQAPGDRTITPVGLLADQIV